MTKKHGQRSRSQGSMYASSAWESEPVAVAELTEVARLAGPDATQYAPAPSPEATSEPLSDCLERV